jgi:hypothetical protein
MDPERRRIFEVMSINRPFRRRDDVRWPRCVGTVVAQVAVTGLVVLGPAAGTGVLAGNTGDTRSLDLFEPVAEVAAGMSVTASSPPGAVTVTQLAVTVPLGDSVAGTGGTS